LKKILELIFEDRRIFPKSIDEQLAFSMSGLRPSFMKTWTFLKLLREVGPEMPEGGLISSTLPVI